jgi:thiamine-phosphate pyrophosphorylase
MAMTMPGFTRPCVYLVTDRHTLAPEARTPADGIAALERWLDEALDAGVDLIQIRERDLEAATLCACVRRVVARARGGTTAVLVNDRADVALAAAADGVHLRGNSPPDGRIRAMASAGWLVGRSVHDVAEAQRHGTADYVLFGTIFPSASKPDRVGQGIDVLGRAAAASAVPVIAIGGIDPARARACAAAGAAGVAGIGVFMPEGRVPGALGPARATAALRAALAEGSEMLKLAADWH